MRPEPKKRRSIFNWDGDDVMAMAEAPMTREQFVSLVFDSITDSTVDAVLWCSASGNDVAYRSNVLEIAGESFGYKYPNHWGWRHGFNSKALAEMEEDQMDIMCSESRKRGIDPFFSLRMNDVHDAGWPEEILPEIKKKHPEWMWGDKMGDQHTALNYGHAALRDLRRRQIVELFQNYDLDGIELDWLRHSMHLELDSEYRLRYVLTDFMRDIRVALDEIAAKRDRYIELLARVPETVEASLREGYDVVTWLGEDLLDGVILGQGHTIPTDYGQWRSLMKNRRVPLYPCVYGYCGRHMPYPDEMIHAIAASFLDAGADGLYTFNWYPYDEFRRELLKTFADRNKLRSKNKHYHAESKSRRPVPIYVRGASVQAGLPVELWATVRDTGPDIPIYCADDLVEPPPRRLDLTINLWGFGSGDRVEVRLNGTVLENGRVAHDAPGPEHLGGGLPIWRAGGKVWIRFAVEAKLVKRGVNIVTVILRERNPYITGNMWLREVELEVAF